MSLLRAIVFAVSCVALAACDRTRIDHLGKAKQYQAQGNRSAALIELGNALSREATNVEALTLMGVITSESGDFVHAQAALKRALEAGGPAERILPMTGRALFEIERYQELLDRVMAAPDHPPQLQDEVALWRGRAFLQLGQYAEARTQFLLASARRPVDARLGDAQILAAEGKASLARDAVATLIRLGQVNAAVWLFHADQLRVEGKRDEALEAYQQVVKLDPVNTEARVGSALTRLGKKDIDGARSDIAAAQQIAPSSPRVQFARALLAFHERKYDVCREAIQQVARQIPEHMPSTLLGGSLLAATGQPVQAQRAFLTYLSRYPGNVNARKMLAASLLQMGQPRSAAFVVEQVIEQGVEDGELLTLAAQANFQAGDIAKARGHLERAVKLDSSNASARVNLGLARMADGRQDLAVAEFEAALAVNPDDAQAERHLILASVARNDGAKALQAALRLEAREPAKAATHHLKGLAQFAVRDKDAAKASFEYALKLDPGYFPAAAAISELDARDGKLDAARARIEAVLKHDKSNLDAKLGLARIDQASGRGAEALSRLRQIIVDHPEALQPRLLLSKGLVESNAAVEAVSIAQQARDRYPLDPQAMEALARAQFAARDYKSAAVTISTWINRSPNSPAAQVLKAAVHVVDGEYKEAMLAARKALQRDARSADAMAILGEALYKSKRYAEMLDLAAITRTVHARFSYALEGDAQMGRGEYAAAAAAFRRADGVSPDGTLRRRIHEAETKAGKPQFGEAGLLDWLKRNPADLETRMYLADHFTGQGRHKEAIEHYLVAVKSHPNDYRIYNNLAWAMQLAGDPRALEHAQQAFQLKPDSAVIADTLGAALIKQGKLNEGLQILLRAVSLDPKNPEIRFRLAETLVRVGDHARARNELKQLLASATNFEGIEAARSLLLKLGD